MQKFKMEDTIICTTEPSTSALMESADMDSPQFLYADVQAPNYRRGFN